MKAYVIKKHGGTEALELTEVPSPTYTADEAVIQIKACAINHLDLWARKGVKGHTFPLPLIPGNDIAGIITEVGSRCHGLALGDEVVVAAGLSCGYCTACASGQHNHCKKYHILGEQCDGGYTEYIAIPRRNIFSKPQNLSFAEAASIGIPFLTAWHMLVTKAQLKANETVLIHAAGSGVGVAAIQIAKMLHAIVITTASTNAKLMQATKLGADHVINYTDKGVDVAQAVKQITGGTGAHVVFEHVGAATWAGSLRALAWQGRLVTCGATTGANVDINLNHLFFKSQSILGSTMGSLGEFAHLLALFERGILRPIVDRTMPLSEVKQAHQLLEERKVFGKIVLQP